MKKCLLLLFLIAVNTTAWSQSFKKKYKDKLEPNSKLIDCGYNYTIEKVNDTLYIYKKYLPILKRLTDLVSFDSTLR